MHRNTIKCFVAEQWDGPLGAARVYRASGWNRPSTLPRLDDKFDAERAKREARERIKEALRKVGRVQGRAAYFFLHRCGLYTPGMSMFSRGVIRRCAMFFIDSLRDAFNVSMLLDSRRVAQYVWRVFCWRRQHRVAVRVLARCDFMHDHFVEATVRLMIVHER